jgi:hypothetical protein
LVRVKVRARVGVRVGFRIVTQPFNTSSIFPNDVTSVRLLEISADQKATVIKYPNTPLCTSLA